MTKHVLVENPYRPGAGHAPPFLAGRTDEKDRFQRLLRQNTITENLVVTGLRGFGKTVLVEHMRATAEAANWLWVGNDLSESSSLTEERLAMRVITDLAQALTDRLEKSSQPDQTLNNRLQNRIDLITRAEYSNFTYDALQAQYEQAAGLPSDRLRAVLTRVSSLLHKVQIKGFVLGYDEAQCLSDKAEQDQFPMSMLIETVSALQKRSSLTPCLLILCGLPQLFDSLTATRTYTERMFQVMTLDRLTRDETRAALTIPIAGLPVRLHTPPDLIEKIVSFSGGYPYLIQFFGRELVEQLLENGGTLSSDRFPSPGALERLDAGLFASRWNKTTDKQREMLALIAARTDKSQSDFSARELEGVREAHPDLNPTNINQTLNALCEKGLLYRTRHGRYAFTVPMAEFMIQRRVNRANEVEASWEPKPKPAEAVPPRQAPIQEPAQMWEKPKKRSWFR